MRAGAISFGLCGVLVAQIAIAAEPTISQCIGANEDAQDLRRAGKLHQAMERLAVCGRPSCPKELAQDCTARLDEIRQAMPTIELVVMDAASESAIDAKVTMDGAPVGVGPGAPIEADPGIHTFEVTADGYKPFATKLTLREKEKDRKESVKLEPNPTNLLRITGFGLGGLGIVGLAIGVGLGVNAKSDYDDAAQRCSSPPSSCPQDSVIQSRDAQSNGRLATGIFVAGGIVAAAGVALVILTYRNSDLRLGFLGSGIRLQGAW